MAENKKLVILGAGWLGNALGEYVLQQGWQCQATHQQVTTDTAPNAQTLDKRVFCFSQGVVEHSLDLADAYWLCAIAPRFRDEKSDYIGCVTAALQLANRLNSKGFLLCSSTGVYPTKAGTYHEQSQLELATTRQQKLHQAEQLVLAEQGKVLRLGGLVGEQREPSQFIAGKTLNAHPDDPVNMVHRSDVMRAITCVFANWQQANGVYNVVNPAHPSKQAYYHAHCAKHKKAQPSFNHAAPCVRIIDGSAIEKLGFSYQFAI